MKQGLIFICLACCMALAAKAQAQETMILKSIKIKESYVKGFANLKTDVYQINSKGILMAKKGYQIRMDKSKRQIVIEHENYPMGRRSGKGGSSDSKPIPGGGGAEFHCMSDKCSDCSVFTGDEGTMVCTACNGCFGGVTIPQQGVSEVETANGNWSPPIW